MIRVGIICPSEIALRRFMPALIKAEGFVFAGIASYTLEERYGVRDSYTDEQKLRTEKGVKKAEAFVEQYGGTLYNSFTEICQSSNIDALYIPLPPALHYKWAKYALEQGKHVLLEKPSTLSCSQSEELVALAKGKGLALHENYMFVFHKQLEEVQQLLDSGEIGDVRLFRLAFGFPRRVEGDFRYEKELGGGAIFDCGGYTLKYADYLLNHRGKIVYATSCRDKQKEVDICGSAALSDDEGNTVQVAFGMENEYKCELEAWGSKGTLRHERIFTAPTGFVPECMIKQGQAIRKVTLSEDDTFLSSICFFKECIGNQEVRDKSYASIVRQAGLVDQFIQMSNIKGL